MFSCDQIMAELGGYLDNEVVADVRRALEVHLAQCQTCRALYDSSRKTLRIVTESSSFELPENVSERVVTKIMSKVRARRERLLRKGSKS